MRKRKKGSLSIPLFNSGFLNGNGSSTVFRWDLQRFLLPAVGLIRCNRRDQRIDITTDCLLYLRALSESRGSRLWHRLSV